MKEVKKPERLSYWCWYVARENEIFCDLDSRRQLGRAMAVLRRVMRRHSLPLQSAYLFPSFTFGKYHLILLLNSAMDAALRARWAMWFGSDKTRGLYTLERLARGVQWADLLITPYRLHREPDEACKCPDKHKALRITRNCPIMEMLLAEFATAEFFPRNRDRKRHGGQRLNWGKLNLRKVRNG